VRVAHSRLVRRSSPTLDRMTSRNVLLIVVCLLSGAYGYLGLRVGAHQRDEAKRKSPFARMILWSTAWSVGTGDEYTEEGKRLCRIGNWILVVWIITWFILGTPEVTLRSNRSFDTDAKGRPPLRGSSPLVAGQL
jgi:hypothetical protein